MCAKLCFPGCESQRHPSPEKLLVLGFTSYSQKLTCTKGTYLASIVRPTIPYPSLMKIQGISIALLTSRGNSSSDMTGLCGRLGYSEGKFGMMASHSGPEK